MAARWHPGDCVVLRAVGPLTVGKPAIVVEDGAERVMLYMPHGVHWLGPASPSGDRVEKPWVRFPSRS